MSAPQSEHGRIGRGDAPSAVHIRPGSPTGADFLINDELYYRAPDVIVGELQVWDLGNLPESGASCRGHDGTLRGGATHHG